MHASGLLPIALACIAVVCHADNTTELPMNRTKDTLPSSSQSKDTLSCHQVARTLRGCEEDHTFIVVIREPVDLSQHLTRVRGLSNRRPKEDHPCKRPVIISRYDFPGFKAYTVQCSAKTAQTLRRLNDVVSVEQDKHIAGPSNQQESGSPEEDECRNPTRIFPRTLTTQKCVAWGLHFISHKNSVRFGSRSYIYDDSAGVGTFAYILDSGINNSHRDLGIRAWLGYNGVENEDGTDFWGHGTAVAGVIGSTSYGVAKRCSMISVKVVDRGGTSTVKILGGLRWAVLDILARNRQAKAVINMSVSSIPSEALDRAAEAAYARGVSIVAAAGNRCGNAGDYSPGRSRGVITVSATDSNYRRWSGSAAGSAVAIFAPGKNIMTLSHKGRKDYALWTGTSFATPFVAGLVLYFKAMHSLPDARSTREHLLRNARPYLVKNPAGGHNLFAYNGNGA